MVSRRRMLTLLGSAVAIAGCGSDGGGGQQAAADLASAEAIGGYDELVSKAKEAGELSLYVGTSEGDTTKWAEAFEKEYGIPFTLYRATSTTLYQRWAQETQTGVHRADILMHSAYQLMERAAAEGWITPYTTRNAGAYDFSTVLPEGSDLARTAYPTYLTTSAVVWNTEVLSPAQQDKLRADPLGAMTDPSFDGLVAFNNPSGGTTVGAYANPILHQEDTYGWAWLEGIAANHPAIYESGIPLAQALVAGEFGVTLGTDSIYSEYFLEGAPVELSYPDPTSAAPWLMAVPTEAPNPYGARLFMEWATSNEGHDLFSKISGGIATRKGWEDQRAIADLPWYEPPAEVWMGWQTEPRLQGDKLEEFIDRANEILGE